MLHQRRQEYIRRHSGLKAQRSTWDEEWRELAEYIQPRRSRFFTSETNQGGKKNRKIINGVATTSARVLAAGIMSGVTSPARPWFRVTTPDPRLSEFGRVRGWLHLVQSRILQAFARSNIYKALANVYLDIGTPGTAAMMVEEDHEEVLRAYVYPIGSYCLATNAKGRVDTMFRESQMTVRQLVGKFRLEKCSRRVQDAYKKKEYDTGVDVVHLLEPNSDYGDGKLGPKGKAFLSCWFESGGTEERKGDGLLKESGYYELPLMAPRWMTIGEDVYGSSPGMDAIGDAKAIQVLERQKGKAVAKLVDPPMRGPSSLLAQQASLLPGAYNAHDSNGQGTKFEPAMEINPAAISVTGMEIREHAERVRSAYYADLWLLLANSDGGKMTAREVVERHEEKMTQLSPVMENIEKELLEPLIDRAFGILMRRGLIPPPPPEIQGQDLKVDYLSIMAEAQKMMASGGIERFVSFTGNLAAVRPDIIDKVNWDEVVDAYGDSLGIKPDLINPDDKVAEIRAARAKAEQAQAQMQQMAVAAEGAKTLASADTEGKNALTDLMGGAIPGVPA
jgi:hypothetical protein